MRWQRCSCVTCYFGMHVPAPVVATVASSHDIRVVGGGAAQIAELVAGDDGEACLAAGSGE